MALDLTTYYQNLGFTSAWEENRAFANWLVQKKNPFCTVELGVDYGYSLFALSENNPGHVFGIDLFEGDAHAGPRDWSSQYKSVVDFINENRLHRTHVIRGSFEELAHNWIAGVDILHIDGLHTYEAVAKDWSDWSSKLNELAGVGSDWTVSLRPMRQEVHHLPGPSGLGWHPVIADLDVGTYMRPEVGGNLVVGGTEPECDELQWIDDPDTASLVPTQALFEAQVTRAARRFPELQVPSHVSGVVGVYDVSSDWSPIYDRTELDGFYIAAGTSGNQFKNAPVAGQLMAHLIDRVEGGHDHDAHPVVFTCPRTGMTVDLGTFSRKRAPNPNSSGTVIG